VSINYNTATLTYDGFGDPSNTVLIAYLTDVEPVDVEPPVEGNVAFGRPQEIVFVNGLAETDQLGIWVLDPANRWTQGDFTRASGWTTRIQVSLVDADTLQTFTDPYVTFNPLTCELVYAGTDTTLKKYTRTVKFFDGLAYSSAFRIRILRPNFTWGDVTYTTLTGLSQYNVPHKSPLIEDKNLGQFFTSNDVTGADDNCVLVTPYPRLDQAWNRTPLGKTATLFDLNKGTSAYLLGVPGTGTEVGWGPTGSVIWSTKNFDKMVVKNIKGYNLRFGCEHVREWVLDKGQMFEVKGEDGISNGQIWTDIWYPATGIYKYADLMAYGWITNYLFTRNGSNASKHPAYLHGRGDPTGSLFAADGGSYIEINNISSYGNASTNQGTLDSNGKPTRVAGGINFKSLSEWNIIRNSYFGATDNWDNPWLGYNSTQLISLHSHCTNVVYNCHFKGFDANGNNFGNDHILLIQNRTIADSGYDKPSYFKKDTTHYYFENEIEYPLIAAYDPAPNEWNTTTNPGLNINPEFHGTNDYVTVIPPVDAPYWASLGNLNDPTNPKVIGTYISYTTFELMYYPPYTPPGATGSVTYNVPNSYIYPIGTHPSGPLKQFQDGDVYYNVPPNWQDRSRVFLINNTYINPFPTNPTKVANNTPLFSKYDYEYSKREPRPAPIEYGGDTENGNVGVPVPFPTGFKY
jgi:hypothetical protein